ncbi:uncharacterized protein TA05000 [Theileria annulata]|uniref:Uncharacterized protein n=1 Tax=Theileria annulata TaxID=5874 RepID=Q4UBR4_THEAN|nr:uncharacterized protein TA05000 [Theileria annulata]CAI75737.1 hypothetical protein TA05000 [Theileria annulata]|eukprot:XP_955213.1 hypothetical protein TA05000 [Theileria annulata]
MRSKVLISGLVVFSFYIISVESRFQINKSPQNNDFISKDISELGLNVYLDEIDFIPHEVSVTGKTKEVCKKSLETNYENDVYGLCEYFDCDIRFISSRPYNDKVPPFTKLPNNIILPNSGNISDQQRKKCNLTKLAARCSSYLRFANCIYINYVDGRRASIRNIKFSPEIEGSLKIYPNSELIDTYFSVDGGTIGFLFREYMQNICSFVHNSCETLHPQFKNINKGYFWSQACVVFDFITPIEGYHSLFSTKLPYEQVESLVSREKEDFVNYQIYKPSNIVFSELNIPLLDPYNTVDQLQEYRDLLLNYRCQLISELNNRTKNLELYSHSGKYRIYAACFELEKYYKKCDLCKKIGVKNTIEQQNFY